MTNECKRVLLIEPPGNFIRQDRCMQSINSWGGAFRFPLELAKIASALLKKGNTVKFIDLQANSNLLIEEEIRSFCPDICITSCGFPSMKHDSSLARKIKEIDGSIHVSTFGVVPSLLKEGFFKKEKWGFNIYFDSAISGSNVASAYASILNEIHFKLDSVLDSFQYRENNDNDILVSSHLFNYNMYRSPFNGEKSVYIEGNSGCPFNCDFCVVPTYYGKRYNKRSPQKIVQEVKHYIDVYGVCQFTLWDEGSTFNKRFLKELCGGLIFLRRSHRKYSKFIWNTRSTTSLIDKDVVDMLASSGLTGLTMGIESFDEAILKSIDKRVSVDTSLRAIELLKRKEIISIGHIILGHMNDSPKTIEHTINSVVSSDLDFAQFYCLVPYPGTPLFNMATKLDLIREFDLTKYELSNPIMNTLRGVSHNQVGEYRTIARDLFWNVSRKKRFNSLIEKQCDNSTLKFDELLSWNYTNISTNEAITALSC